MSYLERAIADRYAKFSGAPNNDIQPVSKKALIGAIKKCHQTLWVGGKLSPPAALRI
jgi:type I restriction enzyme M protein